MAKSIDKIYEELKERVTEDLSSGIPAEKISIPVIFSELVMADVAEESFTKIKDGDKTKYEVNEDKVI